LRTVKGLAYPLITWPNYYCHNSPLKKMRNAGKEPEAQAQLGNNMIWHSSSSCISKASSTTIAPSQVLEALVHFQPPSSQAASPLPEEDWNCEFTNEAQRKKAKAYRVGDLVEVRSVKHDTWIRDAEIIDTVQDKCLKDGFTLRAGSVKVLYNNGERFRWVPPHHAQEHLRPSLRLKAPDTMFGGLWKQCCSDADSWFPVHVEICKGYVQWWESEAAARRGAKSQGHSFLLGMQCWRERRSFKLRVENPNGAIFAFRVDTEEDAGQWFHALWEHARHCMDLLQLETLRMSDHVLHVSKLASSSVDSEVVGEPPLKTVM